MNAIVARVLGWRRVAVAGYAAFGLLALGAFLYASFPYRRLRERLIAVVAEGGQWEMEIGDLGPRILPGVVLHDVVLRSIPDRPEEKPVELRIPRANLGIGLGAALRGRTHASFEAELLGGSVEGTLKKSDAETRLSADAHGIPLGSLPWFAQAVGAALKGGFDAKLDVRLPGGRLADAEGEARLDCRGCATGDGARLEESGGASFMGQGITLPPLGLGDFGGTVKITKGTAKFEGFEARSEDAEASLEGDIQLRDPVGMSQVRGYLRFKFADALKKKEPKFEAIEAALVGGRRSDGYFGVRISGRIAEMRFTASRYAPAGFASARDERRATPGGQPGKPWLSGRDRPAGAAPPAPDLDTVLGDAEEKIPPMADVPPAAPPKEAPPAPGAREPEIPPMAEPAPPAPGEPAEPTEPAPPAEPPKEEAPAEEPPTQAQPNEEE